MVIDVSRVGHEWLRVALQGLLHDKDALLVLLEGKVGDALFVEHLGVASFVLKGRGQVIDCHLVLLHVEVALSSTPEELNLVRFGSNCLVEVVNSFIEIAQLMIAAAESVVHSRIFTEIFRLVEILYGFMHKILF